LTTADTVETETSSSSAISRIVAIQTSGLRLESAATGRKLQA
jgi:hypothetical protein